MDAGRTRRGVAWLAVAGLAVAVVGVLYLRPSLTLLAPAGGPVAARAPAPDRPAVFNVAFGDSAHWAVGLLRHPTGNSVVPEMALTSDGGRSWNVPAGSRGSFGVVALQDGRPLLERFGGPGGQPSVSEDLGLTWRALRLPTPLLGFFSLPTFLDARRGWWLIGTAADPPRAVSVWRTDDGGGTWRRLAGTGIPDSGPWALQFLDDRRGLLTVVGADQPPSLLLTEDGGGTWRPVLTLSCPRPDARSLGTVALLRHGSRVLAWVPALAGDQFNRQDQVVLAGPDAHYDVHPFLFASDDGGRTWGSPLPGPSIAVRSVSPPVIDGGRLLLLDGRRLWTSDDDGVTWTARVIQAPAGLVPLQLFAAGGRTLLTIAQPATAPTDYRFASALLRSTDGGAHWDEVPLPPS
jgi:hypothetical protein